MVPLACREGGRVPLAALLPPAATAADRDRMRRQVAMRSTRLRRALSLRELPLRVEDDDQPHVVIRGIAGTLRMGAREIDIAPKHVVTGSEMWRGALVSMIERAAPRRGGYTASRRLQLRHRTFVDQFAFAYALELETALRDAPVRTYRAVREELPLLRGRLLVADQMRAGLTRPHRLVCEVDALDADNPTNRLLHWVARRLLGQVRDVDVRRFLSHLTLRLPPVSEPILLPSPLVAAVPRQYVHYAGAVTLALAFAHGRTTFPGHDEVAGAGFVIGTERLFESFVERTLQSVVSGRPGWAVRPQASESFAVPLGGGRPYYSRPDNVVDRSGVPTLVVDAKYKRFRDAVEFGARGDRPTNADLYQMAAAVTAHRCRRALLVYPRLTDDDDAPQDPWAISWWRVLDSDALVGAATIDLSLLDDPRALPAFDALVGGLLDDAMSGPSDGTLAG